MGKAAKSVRVASDGCLTTNPEHDDCMSGGGGGISIVTVNIAVDGGDIGISSSSKTAAEVNEMMDDGDFVIIIATVNEDNTMYLYFYPGRQYNGGYIFSCFSDEYTITTVGGSWGASS